MRVSTTKKYKFFYGPVTITACANTADFPAFQNRVLAMLRSVQFHS